jgi:hypothetical protein
MTFITCDLCVGICRSIHPPKKNNKVENVASCSSAVRHNDHQVFAHRLADARWFAPGESRRGGSRPLEYGSRTALTIAGDVELAERGESGLDTTLIVANVRLMQNIVHRFNRDDISCRTAMIRRGRRPSRSATGETATNLRLYATWWDPPVNPAARNSKPPRELFASRDTAATVSGVTPFASSTATGKPVIDDELAIEHALRQPRIDWTGPIGERRTPTRSGTLVAW